MTQSARPWFIVLFVSVIVFYMLGMTVILSRPTVKAAAPTKRPFDVYESGGYCVFITNEDHVRTIAAFPRFLPYMQPLACE